jgi:hypothetical protein
MTELDKDNSKTAQAAERIVMYNIKSGYQRHKISLSKSRRPEFIPKKKYK